MKATQLETQVAPNPWWAARDARMRNIANQSRFTQKEQTAAERMKQGLSLVYGHSGIYINYREKFIAIKVSKPVVKDRKTLKLLEADYTLQGITKKESAQGIIYQVKKA